LDPPQEEQVAGVAVEMLSILVAVGEEVVLAEVLLQYMQT
jgi:hypothetical protein